MKKEYQIIVNYVEGRLLAEEFHKILLDNSSLQGLLKKRYDKQYHYLKPFNYNLYDYFMQGYIFQDKNWNKIRIQYVLQAELAGFLKKNGIEKFILYKQYEEDYDFLIEIQPAWLRGCDDSILQPIIDSIPKDLPKTKRIAMGKEKIKALFKYDKTYPRWVQSPEWPIVNGKPLVFSHQQKAKGGDIRTYYYFYDEDTEKETVIVQFE